ncbi:hypothetical protein [Butyrivibrio sp. VCB2006]|uniref:hypothetical protein n=1 Tax=Butyrivibrio sp. VCB2006 TaxID=1280679 RepID=UPI0004162771|nr:hypothetical protein [Butyrivibrio sp. VCB2006]
MADYTTGTPRTIEELKDYCNKNGYTASKTRFYIGVNYQCAKAFGIYKDEETGEFVVYKNKANGARAIRYKGYDEAYAVNELYQRLLEEVGNQIYHFNLSKSDIDSSRSNFDRLDAYENSMRSKGKSDYNDYCNYSGSSRSSAGFNAFTLFVAIAIILIAFNLFYNSTNASKRSSGGSRYNSYNSYNYNNHSSWNYDDYNYNNSRSSGWDNDWDSGWSSDDWDSGYTDWDSDW